MKESDLLNMSIPEYVKFSHNNKLYVGKVTEAWGDTKRASIMVKFIRPLYHHNSSRNVWEFYWPSNHSDIKESTDLEEANENEYLATEILNS